MMFISNVSKSNGVGFLQLNEPKKTEKIKAADRGQITKLSNLSYKPLSFGRTWAEHKSWGAVIDPDTKEASFKLFTFPDAYRVTATVEKAGNNGETDSVEYELNNKGAGIFESEKIASGLVEHGDSYYYTIYRPDEAPIKVKDPYSFKQEQLLDKSVIYDHSLYEWNDSDWYKSKNRISRLANSRNKLTPLNKAKIYELNIATLTKEGTFEKAEEKLDKIKKLGFNAIEIMPVENTYSFNWGYDGVDKFAPAQYLGGPDKLKELIDNAHQKGLNVIMDMVPNHLGPDGAQLGITGPYIEGPNDFGDSFNFERENSRYVRDYMVNAALNWIDNYHCDGLRLDMTKYMNSDNTMKQIAAEVHYHKPDAFLIAEDGRNNDYRVTSPLHAEEYGKNQNESVHADAIEKISNNNSSLENLGFDSEWDFKFYHNLKELLYGNAAFSTFEFVIKNSEGRVKYIMSHDEIGNYDGTRLISKLMVPMLDLNNKIELSEEDFDRAKQYAKQKKKSENEANYTVGSQKAQLVAEKLATMLQTGKLDDYTGKSYDEFASKVLVPLGIKYNSNLYLDAIKHAYETAFDKNKIGEVLMYSVPGPKMLFQGDENSDLTPFRFFRQFDSVKDEEYLSVEKGYKHGDAAFKESKLGNIEYSKQGNTKCNSFSKLVKDLNLLSDKNFAMTSGYIVHEDTVKHFDSKVFAFHTKDSKTDNELFTVTNLDNSKYPDGKGGDKYYIKFPEGKWVEILNTNNSKYGGNNNFLNKEPLVRNNNCECPVNLATHSAIIFKKID